MQQSLQLEQQHNALQLQQPLRQCHIHLGGVDGGNNLGRLDAPEVTSKDMLRAMMAYIWPKDDALVRKR